MASTNSASSARFPINETAKPVIHTRHTAMIAPSAIRRSRFTLELKPLALNATRSLRITSLKRWDRNTHSGILRDLATAIGASTCPRRSCRAFCEFRGEIHKCPAAGRLDSLAPAPTDAGPPANKKAHRRSCSDAWFLRRHTPQLAPAAPAESPPKLHGPLPESGSVRTRQKMKPDQSW